MRSQISSTTGGLSLPVISSNGAVIRSRRPGPMIFPASSLSPGDCRAIRSICAVIARRAAVTVLRAVIPGDRAAATALHVVIPGGLGAVIARLAVTIKVPAVVIVLRVAMIVVPAATTAILANGRPSPRSEGSFLFGIALSERAARYPNSRRPSRRPGGVLTVVVFRLRRSR